MIKFPFSCVRCLTLPAELRLPSFRSVEIIVCTLWRKETAFSGSYEEVVPIHCNLMSPYLWYFSLPRKRKKQQLRRVWQHLRLRRFHHHQCWQNLLLQARHPNPLPSTAGHLCRRKYSITYCPRGQTGKRSLLKKDMFCALPVKDLFYYFDSTSAKKATLSPFTLWVFRKSFICK